MAESTQLVVPYGHSLPEALKTRIPWLSISDTFQDSYGLISNGSSFGTVHAISRGVVGGAEARARRPPDRRSTMRYIKYVAMLGLAVALTGGMASRANAQVRVGVGIGIGLGPAPVCAYGYYPSYPYACAPYGYYGPNWFVNGVFIGAGPWFHRGPVFVGRPFYRPGFAGRGPAFVGRGPGFVGRGFAPGRAVVRGPVGGFHGGASFHGGGGFRAGGAGKRLR